MIGKNSDPCRPNEVGRRSLLKFLGVFGAYAATSQFISNVTGASQDLKKILLPFERGERELATFPQKRPMILLTSRPPQLETPFSIFNEGVITPNEKEPPCLLPYARRTSRNCENSDSLPPQKVVGTNGIT